MSFGDKLGDQYKLSCEIYGTYPDLKLWKQFKKGQILLNLSEITATELDVVCHAFSQPLTPVMIDIKSTSEDFMKNPDNGQKIQKVLKSLYNTLRVSKTLFTLKFMNLFVPSTSIALFLKGLSLTNRLRSLIFANCSFGKNVVERICLAIKNTACISLLNFDNCQIGYEHLKIISSLIMHQNLNRTSLLWKYTLRNPHPDKEKVSGLTHLVLNNNPLIGDDGLKLLAAVLSDDFWLKGIELENCGISSTSSDIIVNLLKQNKTLEYFSLHRNPFFDSETLSKVDELLCKKSSFKPPPLLKPQEVRSEIISTAENRKIYRKIDLEETLRSKVDIPDELKKIKLGMPWRTQGRIIERNEGLPVGTLTFILEELRKSKPKIKRKKNSDVSNLGISIQNIRNVIKFYKSQWKYESNKRITAEKRMKQLQKKLKHYKELLSDSYVIDDETFTHIEQCFQNFQKFLEKLRSVGSVELKDIEDKLSETSLRSIISAPGVNKKKMCKVNSARKDSTHELSEMPLKNRKSKDDLNTKKNVNSYTPSPRKSKSSVSSKESYESNVEFADEHSRKDDDNISDGNAYSTEFEASKNSSSNDTEEKFHESKTNEKDSSSGSSRKSSCKSSKKIRSSRTNSSNSKGTNSIVSDYTSDEHVNMNKEVKSSKSKGKTDYSQRSNSPDHYTDSNTKHSGKSGQHVLHNDNSLLTIHTTNQNSEEEFSHFSEQNQGSSNSEESFRLKNIQLVLEPNNFHVATDDDKINKIISDSAAISK